MSYIRSTSMHPSMCLLAGLLAAASMQSFSAEMPSGDFIPASQQEVWNRYAHCSI